MYHEEKIPKNNKKGNIKIRKFSIKIFKHIKLRLVNIFIMIFRMN